MKIDLIIRTNKSCCINCISGTTDKANMAMSVGFEPKRYQRKNHTLTLELEDMREEIK